MTLRISYSRFDVIAMKGTTHKMKAIWSSDGHTCRSSGNLQLPSIRISLVAIEIAEAVMAQRK
jgi:hypothetical protein